TNFGVEGSRIGIAARGFDVYDDVKTVASKWKPLGVSLQKADAGISMSAATKGDCRGREIQPDDARGPEELGDHEDRASSPTADIEHHTAGRHAILENLQHKLHGILVEHLLGKLRARILWAQVGHISVIEKEGIWPERRGVQLLGHGIKELATGCLGI